MKHFVVLSAAGAERGRALSVGARAFGAGEGWPAPAELRLPGPGLQEVLVWGADAADVMDGDRQEAAVLFARAAFDQHGERLTPRMLLERFGTSGPGSLAGVAAPQSLLLATGSPVRVTAATDHVGLSAVYHGAYAGTAAASSSSRLLAAILGGGLDEDAVSAFSVIGEYAASDTPFRRVRRLGAGECVTLVAGTMTVDRYCPRATPGKGPRDVDLAVRDGVAAVRAGVDACSAAYPDAAMELSGGLDSRVILAALLAGGHRPSEAMTLGERTHPDMVIAGDLAGRTGMPHEQVDLSEMARLSPADALRLVDAAGRRRDYSGNCVALGVLEWVDEVTGSSLPRFSGQNGELARGFYYPFQPPWPRTTDLLARALVRWRLMANERVSSDVLTPDVTAAGERRAAETTQAFLEGTGCDWLTATDMLYLHWRMQRWVGGDWSAAGQSRVVLAPFFHPAYISWALSVPPRMKRGSRLLARVLHAIDPDLARLPTAGGESPTAFFEPGVAHRISHAERTARKVGVKVRQRLRDSARPPVGAPLLADLALGAMVDERLGLERVAALPFVSREYVERVAESRQASPATVGLLAGLRGLTIDGDGPRG